MFPLSLPARCLCVVIALALSAAWGWRQGILSTEARYAQARAEATDEARRIESRRADMVADVARSTSRQIARNADAGAGAAVELERLRNVLAQRDEAASAAAAARDAGADPAGIVVGQCASRLVEVAKAADAAEARLQGLQQWSGVCLDGQAKE